MLSAGSGSSIPCASLAAFGAGPLGSCGDPAVFQGWAADWWDGMADQIHCSGVCRWFVIADGNVWGLFIKAFPSTQKESSPVVCGKAWALFAGEEKAEEGLSYHTKQGRRDDWSICFCPGWWLWGLFWDSTGCCCTCACLPQCVGTNVASRMFCLLLQAWYLKGMAGEGQIPSKSKVFPIFCP